MALWMPLWYAGAQKPERASNPLELELQVGMNCNKLGSALTITEPAFQSLLNFNALNCI